MGLLNKLEEKRTEKMKEKYDKARKEKDVKKVNRYGWKLSKRKRKNKGI